LTVETFLLEATGGDTPGEIEVMFRHFIRDERRFPSPDELKAQILKDVSRADAYWRHAEKLLQPLSSIY
jgi:riboflavin kinase/FMN adenylyltransferase